MKVATAARLCAPFAVALIACAGLAFRVWLSRAPLWTDEIWSLLNLGGLTNFTGVLWGVSHDNNHFLNSLWLYFVSPATSDPTALRLVSLIAGALAIPAMAALGARRDAPTALAAATLTALSFFQITYSAEARGYAAATLAVILAYREIERALDAPTFGVRWRFALASGLGFFCHLAFAPAVAGFAVIAFFETLRRGARIGEAVRVTFGLVAFAALAMAPTLAFLAAGFFAKGGFTIGAFTPFSVAHAIGGLAHLEMATFGLDTTSYPETTFAIVGLPALILAAIYGFAAPERRIAYLVTLVAFPAAALLARAPNTHVGRYFFVASPFLILLAAESFGALWRKAGVAQIAGAAALAAAMLSDEAAVARLSAGEEAPWTAALDVIAASADPTLASSHDFNVGKSVSYFDRIRDARIALIAPERLCAARPAWYVLETPGGGEAQPLLQPGAPACETRYALVRVFNRNIPSQRPWALYARADLRR